MPIPAPQSGSTPSPLRRLAIPQPANAPGGATAAGSASGAGVPRQERFTLTIDLPASRIYVLDRDGEPVDRYLTSPGVPAHPTRGTSFTIGRALLRPSWNPPDSPWAKGLKPVGPGPNNPMGVLKLDLGRFAQYIHGSPPSERAKLGRPASHGCLRLSNENVLHLFKHYAGVGTRVDVIRDPAGSRELATRYRAGGRRDRALADGADLVAPAWKGILPEPVTY